jgi:two-component sensor histidine kinase
MPSYETPNDTQAPEWVPPEFTLLFEQVMSELSAFPDRRKGQVEVTLRSAGTDVVLGVADNGVGFPTNLDFRSPSTLGLKLVAIFTEQVGGTIDLERAGGTRFSLRFTPGTRS